MDRKLLNVELGRISAEQYKKKERSGIAVILDNVRSAHNVGSIFRSSDAFGIDFIALCGICAVPPSAEIHKSALGAEDSVDWMHFDRTEDALQWLRERGYAIACVEQTEKAISLEKLGERASGAVAFIFGNEVDGVQQSVVDASDFSIEIPQWGTKHSLNVSVSAGIVLWEAVKILKII